MTQLLCHLIAVPGGAGQRMGHSSGGHHDRPTGIEALFPLYPFQKRFRPAQPLRPVLHNGYAGPAQGVKQGVYDVRRSVRLGENPVSPLGFQGHSLALKKFLDLLGRKTGDGAGEKPAVLRDVPQYLLGRTVVGHIAAAFSRNI